METEKHPVEVRFSAEFKKNLRRLAKKYHPDHLAHLDQTSQRRHTEKMTLINAAYDTIRAERDFK